MSIKINDDGVLNEYFMEPIPRRDYVTRQEVKDEVEPLKSVVGGMYSVELESSYDSRTTALGFPIIDGGPTTVKKITGQTVEADHDGELCSTTISGIKSTGKNGEVSILDLGAKYTLNALGDIKDEIDFESKKIISRLHKTDITSGWELHEVISMYDDGSNMGIVRGKFRLPERKTDNDATFQYKIVNLYMSSEYNYDILGDGDIEVKGCYLYCTFDTGYTGYTVDTYFDNMWLSGYGADIVYERETPLITDIENDSYIAYVGGTEQVLGNDYINYNPSGYLDTPLNLYPTITQEYYLKAET